MHQNEANNALYIPVSVLEEGRRTLRGFADSISVPELGPAIEIVCGCVEVYTVSILLNGEDSTKC